MQCKELEPKQHWGELCTMQLMYPSVSQLCTESKLDSAQIIEIQCKQFCASLHGVTYRWLSCTAAGWNANRQKDALSHWLRRDIHQQSSSAAQEVFDYQKVLSFPFPILVLFLPWATTCPAAATFLIFTQPTPQEYVALPTGVTRVTSTVLMQLKALQTTRVAWVTKATLVILRSAPRS